MFWTYCIALIISFMPFVSCFAHEAQIVLSQRWFDWRRLSLRALQDTNACRVVLILHSHLFFELTLHTFSCLDTFKHYAATFCRYVQCDGSIFKIINKCWIIKHGWLQIMMTPRKLLIGWFKMNEPRISNDATILKVLDHYFLFECCRQRVQSTSS